MEGHGTVSPAALEGLPALIVRGGADLVGSEVKKSEEAYAAWTAATYVRALLEECPPFDPTPANTQNEVAAPSRRQLENIVDAIMESQVGQDETQQLSFLNLVLQSTTKIDFPSVDARERLRSVLFDCAHYRWGRVAVVGALEEIALGRGEAVRKVEAAIQENWPIHT